MQTTDILTQFRLLLAAAILLKESFDKNEPPEKLRASFEMFRAHLVNLKRFIPEEIVERSELNRHIHWVDHYLSKGKPDECYKDIWDICNNDIFNVQQEYFSLIESTDNDTPQIKAIKKQLLLLRQPGFTSSSWITTTERILRLIFPRENIKLQKYRSLPDYMPLSGQETESYENLLNGFIDELKLDIPSETADKWSIIHPEIVRVARSLFETKHYGKAAESGFIELNDKIKKNYKVKSGKEKDGDSLFREVFSANHAQPHYQFDDISTESGRNVQQGYMEIFAGAWKGIRNPNTHANLEVHPDEAWEIIVLASHLMRMWDKCQENNTVLKPN